MKIINKNVSMKVKLADSYFKRLKGLMFKKNPDYGLLIKTNLGSTVHSCFMNFPIDIYFIKDSIIFDSVILNPWSYYKPKKDADFVLEFAEGSFKIDKGDEVLVMKDGEKYLRAFHK